MSTRGGAERPMTRHEALRRLDQADAFSRQAVATLELDETPAGVNAAASAAVEPGGRALSNSLGRLLAIKSDAQYNAKYVTRPKADAALRQAHALTEAARKLRWQLSRPARRSTSQGCTAASLT